MCSEVMYGAYYPYLYAGRAGPGRPFYHQYDRVRKLVYAANLSTQKVVKKCFEGIIPEISKTPEHNLTF